MEIWQTVKSTLFFCLDNKNLQGQKYTTVLIVICELQDVMIKFIAHEYI